LFNHRDGPGPTSDPSQSVGERIAAGGGCSRGVGRDALVLHVEAEAWMDALDRRFLSGRRVVSGRGGGRRRRSASFARRRATRSPESTRRSITNQRR
jgi:hypothetical protein